MIKKFNDVPYSLFQQLAKKELLRLTRRMITLLEKVIYLISEMVPLPLNGFPLIYWPLTM